MGESIDNPLLSSPYEQQDQYFEIGPKGPTGLIRDGRRPSESLIPIAGATKGKRAKDGSEQVAIDFDVTGERRERNSLINDLRREVERWRRGQVYNGVTPITRKLLQHFADPTRENRVFTGGNDPYMRLKIALKVEIDAGAWASLYSTVSRPFSRPSTGKIAVKVINDYGDEVMKVLEA